MIRVEAYAGAVYPEHPTAVWLEGRRYCIEQVLRSWRAPGSLHFLVALETGARLEIRYLFGADEWSLIRTLEEPL